MNTREFIRQTPPLAWLIMLTVLCAGIFGNLLGNLTTELSADLALTPKHIGWVIFCGSTGSAIGAFLGGEIAYRFRPMTLLNAYLAGMVAAIGLLVSAHGFASLAVGFMVYEVMITALLTLAHTLIGQMSLPTAIRARTLALLDVGWSVGASVAPVAVVVLLRLHPSWRLPFAAFIALVLLLIVVYNRAAMRTAIEGLHIHRLTDTNNSNATPSHSYRQLLTAPWAIWAWVAAVLIGYVEWGHTYWFVNYAHQGREIALDTARWGLLAFTAGMMVARAWQTFIHSHLTTEQRLMRLGLLGCAMFILIAALPTQAATGYLLFSNFFAGVGIGIVFPILLNHLIDFAPRDTAKFSALLMFSIIFGSQMAGLVIGYIANTLGIHWGYATIALAMVGFTLATAKLFAVHRQIGHVV